MVSFGGHSNLSCESLQHKQNKHLSLTLTSVIEPANSKVVAWTYACDKHVDKFNSVIPNSPDGRWRRTHCGSENRASSPGYDSEMYATDDL